MIEFTICLWIFSLITYFRAKYKASHFINQSNYYIKSKIKTHLNLSKLGIVIMSFITMILTILIKLNII